MKNHRSIASMFFLFLTGLIFSASGYAAVTIDGQFEGTLVITSPDGEINLIEPGDAIPTIANDSIVEVFDGKFKLTAVEGDKVSISCLEHEGAIAAAASVTLSCGESSGQLKVEAGTVSMMDDEGKPVEVKAGETYDIKMPALQEAAPATAEGQELGLPATDAAVDVNPDSRNIQIQDNQTQDASPEQ